LTFPELSPSLETSRGPKTVAMTRVLPISKDAEPSLNLPLITPIAAFTDLNSCALLPSNLKPRNKKMFVVNASCTFG
jgi:hypothetical protein